MKNDRLNKGRQLLILVEFNMNLFINKKIGIGLIIFGIILLVALLIQISQPAPLIEIGKIAYTPEKGAVGERVAEEQSSELSSRLVIKTGNLNIVVKNIEDSVKKIIEYSQDKEGWVVTSNITEIEKIPSGIVIVRVPAEKFDEAITYFKGLAERVVFEGTQGQDITEEYVDLQSRLKNLEAAENQLLKLMERSGKLSEVLEVQRELTRTREEIELIKGRMQYLKESTEMATITVNLALSEDLLPIPPAEKWRPKYILLQAWKNVLSFWREFSYFLIRIIVWSAVWLPFGLVIWYGKKFWKKRQKPLG